MQVHTLTWSNQMLSDCVRSDAPGRIWPCWVYEIKMKFTVFIFKTTIHTIPIWWRPRLERIYDRANVWNLDRAQSTRPRDDRARPRPHSRLLQCAQVLIRRRILNQFWIIMEKFWRYFILEVILGRVLKYVPMECQNNLSDILEKFWGTSKYFWKNLKKS